MPLDVVSTSRLKLVHPEVARRVTKLNDFYEAAGYEPFRVTAGMRSWTQQAADWFEGRNAKGVIIDESKVITHAEPGRSWHQFGLAADLVPMSAGDPIWDRGLACWAKIVVLAPSVGLASGAEFHDFPDWPHVQLVELQISPSDEDAVNLKAGGVEAYWSALNAKIFSPGTTTAA